MGCQFPPSVDEDADPNRFGEEHDLKAKVSWSI